MFARALALLLLLSVAVAVIARQSHGAGPERTYVVKAHDTLWSIAAASYGGDPRDGVWKLRRRNHLADALIRPGQKLHIPR